MAAGSVTLTAQAEGMEAEASLEIRSDDLITVTVVDGVTEAPMEGARVQDADEKVTTDKSGQAQLHVPSEGAPWVMVYSGEEGWIPAVFMGAGESEITVPLRPNPEVDSAMVALTGETDFQAAARPPGTRWSWVSLRRASSTVPCSSKPRIGWVRIAPWNLWSGGGAPCEPLPAGLRRGLRRQRHPWRSEHLDRGRSHAHRGCCNGHQRDG